MNDLISRSGLLVEVRRCKEAVAKCANHDYMIGYASALSAVEGQIADAPVVDAEPVRHGQWIPQDNTRTKFQCSDCKSRNHDGSGKWCSNCGCKMDAEVKG